MLYLQLLWVFFKIGALSFGGGLAMVPIIQREMQATGWMTAAEVADIVALSEMTPGPLAINAATFAGIRSAGIFGGVIATLGVSLPSLILSLLAAKFFFAVRDSRLVSAGMTGIRPAVAGMVGASAIHIVSLTFTGHEISKLLNNMPQIDWFSVILAVTCFILLLRKVSPVLLIVLSAGTGLLWRIISQTFF